MKQQIKHLYAAEDKKRMGLWWIIDYATNGGPNHNNWLAKDISPCKTRARAEAKAEELNIKESEVI